MKWLRALGCYNHRQPSFSDMGARIAVCWLLFSLAYVNNVAHAAEAVKTADDKMLYGKFPDGFMWGLATASYQIEGAWNTTGKGKNIWDTFSHAGNNVVNNDTGDVACDSYHKFKQDVQLLKAMKVTHYRFSISWSRVMTDGTNTTYNPSGIQYYHSLIDELVANGIVPMATLYHWDLPQDLQDRGGWLNKNVVTWFNNYARTMFKEYASKVPLWITFNEPWVFCWAGYGRGDMAPNYKDAPGSAPYTCIHHVILAHAQTYWIYHSTSIINNQPPGGKISITLNADWKQPKDPKSASDVAAAERAEQFMLGWIAHPIYVNGDYPQIMKDQIAKKSTAAGLLKSRLPVFTQKEKDSVKGTFDFFGLNHYTTQYVEEEIQSPMNSTYVKDIDSKESVDPKWPSAKSSWLKVVPWGLRRLLNWIKNEYNNPPLYITENGVSDGDGTLQDTMRVNFYRDYINNVLKAVNEDGCDVQAYTAWSLMDNFEWAKGYSEKFGVHQVNFSDPSRPRTPKKSAEYLTELFEANGFVKPQNGFAPLRISLTAAVVSIICFLYGNM